MACEAEIVVRAKHDDTLAVDDSLGAFVVVQRLVEGVEAERFCRLGQRESACFAEYVAACGVVIAIDLKGVDVD
jgi:hypothetical protein